MLEQRRLLAGDVVLSEIKINPVGSESRYEYVEIRGVPGQELKNLRFVSLAGDGADAGKATFVVSLHGAKIGNNGLLVIKSTSGGHTLAADTAIVTDNQFDPSAGALGDGTNTFLLVRGVTVTEGNDYDLDNDGQLDDAMANAEIVDAIAVKDRNSEGHVYGGVVLTQATGLPQAVTRFLHDNRPSTVGAWYGGNLTGTSSALTYSSNANERSSNFPTGGVLTPGQINVPGANTAPVGNSDAYTVEPGAILAISDPALGLLANDADPDDALAPGGKVWLSAKMVSPPEFGQILVFRPDGTFTYLAAEDGPSEVTFVYRATDMNLLSQDITVTIQIGAAANQPPVLQLPGPEIDYAASNPALVLDSSASVTDADSPALAGGMLAIDIVTGGDAGDELAIHHVGSGAGEIGVSGTDVTFGGVLIGSIASNSGSSLSITLNASATLAAAQSLARSITYRNTLPWPAITPRVVRFVLSDGAGGTSEPATKTVHVTRPELPEVSIADAAAIEGDSGGTTLGFVVTLSAIPVVDVVVTYSTADLSAKVADGDYTPVVNQTITFPAGTTTLTQTIEIVAHGDNKHEVDDQFAVTISAAGASVLADTAIGTITNDDAAPTVLIQSASVTEGDSGTVELVFAVTLSHPSYQDVVVSYVTSDGTATLTNQDYQYASGSLTFPANALPVAQSISVLVRGDDDIEGDEAFQVDLTSTGAANASSSVLGTIINDDFLITAFAVHADLVGANGKNNGQADTFRLLASGANIELYLNGSSTPAALYPLASTLSIEVQGSNDDDTLILDQSGGLITAELVFSGGLGFDTLRIEGTDDDDRIDVAQDSPTHLRYEIGNAQQAGADGVLGGEGTKSVTLTAIADVSTVENVLIAAGAGDDVVQITHSDSFIANGQAAASWRFTIEGGSGDDDRLLVVDDGLGDTTVQRLGADALSGSYQVGALQPVLYTGIELAGLTPVDPITGGTGHDAGGGQGQLVVFPQEASENDSLQQASSLPLNAAAIAAAVDAGDEDWYRIAVDQTGVLDISVRFRVSGALLANGRAGLPGGGDLALDLFDAGGALVNTSFIYDGSSDHARARIPVVAGKVYYARVHGNGSAINAYQIQADSSPAPVPAVMELTPADLNTTVVVQVADAQLIGDTDRDNDMPAISIPFVASLLPTSPASGFRVAIFVKPASSGVETLAGYAQPQAGSPGLYSFTFPAGALPDGEYQVSSRVEIIDPAVPIALQAWGAASPSLSLVVDTTPPAVAFGTEGNLLDGLHPSSDTGVAADPETSQDRRTADTTPTFWGSAEPGALVRVYIDRNHNGQIDAADALLAQTTADTQTGHWEATASSNFDEGTHRLLVEAEDQAGNMSVMTPETRFEFVVDTQAPAVTGLFITSTPNFQLLSTTPTLTGPTPLITSLTIGLSEPVAASTAQSPDHYSLRGMASGVIPISGVSHAVVSGQSTIVLSFAQPLPDEEFIFTLSDTLRDVVGHALDGETNAEQPTSPSSIYSALLPRSGDGQPGGDFVVRFTVDSRAELGAWLGESIEVDTNGNGVSDPDNADFTHRDLTYQLAQQPHSVFVGNFSLNPTADGFDKLASYVEIAGQFYFLVDVDHDGIADNDSAMLTEPDPDATALSILGLPIAGRFDANDVNGDEVGVFDGTTWHFDTNHNFIIDSADLSLASSLRGVPLVGDFDGDGFDDLATWANDQFQIDLAVGVRGGWDGQADFVIHFGFASENELPIAADMNADGIDDLGLWVPDVLPAPASGQWFFIVSGQDAEGTSIPLVKAGLAPGDAGHRVQLDSSTEQAVFNYQPAPLGGDLAYAWGARAAKPIVGNFNPPLTGPSGGTATGYFTNPAKPLDVDGDGSITPTDVALVISQLNAWGPVTLTSTLRSLSGPFFDVSGDGILGPIDALLIVNHLNAVGSGEGNVPEIASLDRNPPSSNDTAYPVTPPSPQSVEANRELQEDAEPNLVIDSLTPAFYYWMWESAKGTGETDAVSPAEESSELLELLAVDLLSERN